MGNIIPNQEGSYVVRDKKGTYMGGYSEKLGLSNAMAWATDCAKQSRGIVYFRKAPELEEEEVANFLDYGRKGKKVKPLK
jgi:hypothetical protein|tara:strand:- start:1538 stop:1777 length:240 start_codon:yes stop_codon:yes gene_type:complete